LKNTQLVKLRIFLVINAKKISIFEKRLYIRIVILTGRIKISGYEYEL